MLEQPTALLEETSFPISSQGRVSSTDVLFIEKQNITKTVFSLPNTEKVLKIPVFFFY
jgi:hypothetical protein